MKIFESLSDMPLYNWEKFTENPDKKWLIDYNSIENSLSHRVIKKWKIKQAVKLLTDSEFSDGWDNLYDEFLVKSGQIDTMIEWKNLVEMRMEARERFAEGDESQQNWIDYYTSMIDNLMKKGEDQNIVKNRVIIQKLYEQRIDPKTTSVAEFLEISNLVKEINKPVKNTTDAAN